MSTSLTRTSTFTYTDALYLSSKLGADLRGLNARYGRPNTADTECYIEEAALLLQAGYLGTVDYGFKDGQRWVLRLRYTATAGGQLRNDSPGGLPVGLSMGSYAFFSYLAYSSTFHGLSAAEQADFKARLPVQRTSGVEPTTTAGSSGYESQYARHGVGLNRDVYVAI